MASLLAGLTVAEASRTVRVRYCGRLFAQLGATVVHAAGGDDTAIGYGGDAGEAYGRWLDAGKVETASAAPDLVIVDEARAGEGPTTLELTWFHPDGPYAAWRGTDELIQALGGCTYALGPPQGPPVLAQGHGPQLAAGLVGFNAALGALLGRGRPRRIQVNALEAYLCLTETGAISALLAGGTAVRLGVNRLVPTYPCNSYRSADGYVGVTALTPAQWAAFCAMIAKPELARQPRFASTLERLMLADEVDALVAPPLTAKTTAEWVALGEAAKVPIAPMPDLREMPQTPHWRARGSFAPYDDSGLVAPTAPFRFDVRGAARPLRRGPATAPLQDLKVVDFTMGWAGPLAARTLADLGAEVVKIESLSHPDWWRGWEVGDAAEVARETKYSFISVNRNKRGVALELSTAEGLAAAKALIAEADVVIENFAAGVMEKLGLGADVRRRLNPRLISVAMPAFGGGGPLSGVRAYGSTVEQASGLPFVNGEPDWPPSLQHVAFGDPLAGLFAAVATLAALKAGAACEIDLAQVECLFQFGADAFIAQQLSDDPLPRTGSRRPRAAPVCVAGGAEADSWLAVAVDGDAAWRGLCGVLGRPEWAGLDLPQRSEGADEIEAAIAGWARARAPEAAAEALQAAGVPAAPVQPTHALCYDPQLSATGFFAEMERPYVGSHLVPNSPWLRDGERPALYRPAPTLGEHTDEVLAELKARAG